MLVKISLLLHWVKRMILWLDRKEKFCLIFIHSLACYGLQKKLSVSSVFTQSLSQPSLVFVGRKLTDLFRKSFNHFSFSYVSAGNLFVR